MNHPVTLRAERWGATAPFLLIALLLSIGELLAPFPMLQSTLNTWIGWVVFGVWVLACSFALFRGLPTWSLPTVGIVLGIGAFILSGNGSIGGIELRWQIPYPSWIDYRGRTWLPIVAILALLIVLCAVVPWFRPLYRRFRSDWSQPAFAIYGLTPLAMLMLLDEYRYKLPLTIAGLLILAGGAWIYMGATPGRRRLLTLVTAVTLMMLQATLGAWLLRPLQVWANRFPDWNHFLDALANWAWVTGALLAPALLALLPRAGSPAAPSTPEEIVEPPAIDEPPDTSGRWVREIAA